MRTLTLTAVLALFVAAPAALATTTYPDYYGTNIDFTLIQETSNSGDPEPLFGAPTGTGNQLLFFPPNFVAQAAGASGYDLTGAQLQMQVSGSGSLDTITDVLFTEAGDATLLGAGTAGTMTFASLAGQVTVLADINGPITPVIISFTGTFSPSDTLTLPSDFGTTTWSGTVSVDVASVVPNATVAFISLDNDLYAFSEAGTSAKIQKKVASGPAILVTVIPEPATGSLLGLGLIGLALSKRARAR